jgi:hypothetical protein
VAEHRVADRHVEGTVVEGQVAPIADDERQPGDVGPERAGALHEHLGRVDPDDRSEAGPGGDGPRHRARAAPDLEHVRAGGERKLGRVLVERGRLVVDERQRALEEPGDLLLLLSGHGVEANEQSDSDHQALPSV